MYVILINFSADIRKLCLLKKMSNTVKMIYIYMLGYEKNEYWEGREMSESDKRKRVELILVMVLDVLALMVSYGAANYIRNGSFIWKSQRVAESTVFLYILLVYIVVSFFRNTKKDFFERGYLKELVDIIKETTGVLAILIITLFLLKISTDFSRVVIVSTYLMVIGLQYVLRNGFKLYVKWRQEKNFYTKRLVILTMMDKVPEIMERLNLESMYDYKLKGWILLDAPDDMIEKEYYGAQVMGNYFSMYDCLTQRVVDEVYINVPYRSGVHVGQVIERYEDMGLTVNLNVNIFDIDLKYAKKELRSLGGMYAITFQQSVVDMKMRVVKRIMDIAGALVGLVITGVVTIFLAPVLLLESPGPLIFSQTRVGLNGRKFKFYKFRSMYKDAEERKKELMAKNQMSGLMFKMDDDPRITKVGKFIRKTSIDELPQFWNVLKGDMSLIGTRPPTVDEFEKYKTQYKRRLSIRPGITGLWQATGRSDITDFEEVLKLDLEYIDNWSISLDIKILFMTVFGVLLRKGAK